MVTSRCPECNSIIGAVSSILSTFSFKFPLLFYPNSSLWLVSTLSMFD